METTTERIILVLSSFLPKPGITSPLHNGFMPFSTLANANTSSNLPSPKPPNHLHLTFFFHKEAVSFCVVMTLPVRQCACVRVCGGVGVCVHVFYLTQFFEAKKPCSQLLVGSTSDLPNSTTAQWASFFPLNLAPHWLSPP